MERLRSRPAQCFKGSVCNQVEDMNGKMLCKSTHLGGSRHLCLAPKASVVTHNVPMVTKPAEDAQERKHSSQSASKPMKRPRVSFSCQPFPSPYPFNQWQWTIKDSPSGGACHLHGAERERLCVLKRTLYIDSYKLS